MAPRSKGSSCCAPFPQFTSIMAERYDGEAVYNSLQLRVERRFADGYTLNGAYTFSRLTEKASLLNPTDPDFEERRSRDDYPHRLVISGIYELPIGRGRRVLGNAGRLLDALVGGFQVQGIYQYQSGRPLLWGNVAYFGDEGNCGRTSTATPSARRPIPLAPCSTPAGSFRRASIPGSATTSGRSRRHCRAFARRRSISLISR